MSLSRRAVTFFVTTFTFLSGTVFAQKDIIIDSLRMQLKQDSAWIYRPRKVLVLLSLDQRNTFLETSVDRNTPVNMQGIKAGLTVNQRQRMGIGAYRIVNSRAQISRVDGKPVALEFHFNYMTLFYEYYFIHTRLWDVGLPMEVGLGRYTARDTSVARQGLLTPIGTGVDVRFKPHRWVSLNMMGGYRFVGNNNNPVKLSNWFYAFGVSLSTRNMYNDARYYLKKHKFRKTMLQI